MKKINWWSVVTAAILGVSLPIYILGCNESANIPERFTYRSYTGTVTILTDNETGEQYIITSTGGICHLEKGKK